MRTPQSRRLSRRSLLQSAAFGSLLAGVAAGAHAGTAAATPGVGAGLRGRLSQSGSTPSPQWDSVYRAALGTQAMGYAWAVAQNGTPLAGAGVNLSRSGHETANPSQAWTLDTLFNLASLSKAITAVGFMALAAQQGMQILDQPFWPILTGSGRFSGTPAAGVETITIRQLLTHYSGITADPAVTAGGKTVDQFLSDYLQKPLAHSPGSTYEYSNVNYDAVSAVYEILSGAPAGGFTQLIQTNVFTPMGIDSTREIVDTPDPSNEGVSYSDPSDTRPGQVWPKIDRLGIGGWLGTVNGVLKFLTGIRSNAVLDPPTTQLMLTQQLGWFADASPFGQYYHKNGILNTGGTPPQRLQTGIAIFPGGYDAVLFVNSGYGATNPITLLAKAFGASPPTRD